MNEDVTRFGYLQPETKAQILARVKEVSVEDEYSFRREKSKITDGEVLRRYRHLESELERPGTAEEKIENLSQRLGRALPIFAQLYKWSDQFIALGEPSFPALAPRDVPLTLEANDDACIVTPIAFTVVVIEGPNSITYTSLIDQDLYALLTSPIQQAFLRSRERFMIISLYSGFGAYESSRSLNPSLFGDFFWNPWDYNLEPQYLLSKGLQNTLFLSIGPYFHMLRVFAGQIDPRRSGAKPSAFTRMFSWGTLKVRQHEKFMVEMKNREKTVPEFLAALSESEAIEKQAITDPETAFMYLADLRLTYTRGREEKMSYLGHTPTMVGVEHLMSLSEENPPAFEMRQRAYLEKYCQVIRSNEPKVREKASAPGASVADTARAQIFGLALQYCETANSP